MRGPCGFSLSVVLAAAALAGVLSVRATNALPASAALLSPPQDLVDPGERVMNANCQECHDVRRIQTQAKSAEEWTQTIEKMISNGAKISRDDVSVLVKYLSFRHGPMPDGPGKNIVLNICTMCHDLGRVKFGRRSAEEWEETLSAMLNEGAPLSDQDFPVVHHYLSENYGID